ncbi:MAG TPA: hypothetical protein VGL56_12925 [Fimbriimonadaceae bacterium]|jgi:hypothetical protein
MGTPDQEVFDPTYWLLQLPDYPKPASGGAPLALGPYLASKILVNIAHGALPKAAFAAAGISNFTYSRYLKRAAANSESEIDQYLSAYFELQNRAQEEHINQFAEKQLELMGKPKPEISVNIVTKTRHILKGGRIITLRDTTETRTEKYSEGINHFPEFQFNEHDFESDYVTIK